MMFRATSVSGRLLVGFELGTSGLVEGLSVEFCRAAVVRFTTPLGGVSWVLWGGIPVSMGVAVGESPGPLVLGFFLGFLYSGGEIEEYH